MDMLLCYIFGTIGLSSSNLKRKIKEEMKWELNTGRCYELI